MRVNPEFQDDMRRPCVHGARIDGDRRMPAEERTDVNGIAGRTTSPELDRLLTLIWPILLWMLGGTMLRGISSPYVSGFVDGAFVLIVTRAAVMLGRDYVREGGAPLDQARGGLVIGLGLVLALVVLSGVGVYLFWK
jgi:hypothetical protein